MRLHAPIALAVLSAASLARAEVSLNVIAKVNIEEGGDTATVSISGSKPPNFTTMWMVDPPRFIVDLSESTFEGVPSEVPGKGMVSSVQNLSYGKDASAIARVVITYGKEINPPDVQTVGGTLVVKAKLPGGAAVASSGDDAKAKARAEEEARARDAKAKADADAKAKVDAEAREKADADAKAKARADADAREKADADARADAEAREKADADSKAKARADAEAREKADADARAQARTRADEGKRAKAEADAREEERRKEEARDAAAREREATERARAQEVARADEEPRTRSLTESSPPGRREGNLASPSPEPVPAVEPRARSSRSDRSEPAGRPQRLREVGFRQLPEVSRVFLRTSGTPEFTISEMGQDVVRVELANTRARRHNDRRLLDTSFFRSAVSAITPKREGSNYVLEIKLRQRVSYQQKIEGDMLAIDFERPPALRGGAAPVEPAAAEPAPSAPAASDSAVGPAPQEESSPGPAPSP